MTSTAPRTCSGLTEEPAMVIPSGPTLEPRLLTSGNVRLGRAEVSGSAGAAGAEGAEGAAGAAAPRDPGVH